MTTEETAMTQPQQIDPDTCTIGAALAAAHDERLKRVVTIGKPTTARGRVVEDLTNAVRMRETAEHRVAEHEKWAEQARADVTHYENRIAETVAAVRKLDAGTDLEEQP